MNGASRKSLTNLLAEERRFSADRRRHRCGALVRALVRDRRFAVIAGLLFVEKAGAAPSWALTITANILTSLAIDHFELFGCSAAFD